MFVFVAAFSTEESDCSNHEGVVEEGGGGDDCDPCRRFLFFNGPLALSSLMRRFRRLVGKAEGGGDDGGRRRDAGVSGGVADGRVCAGDGGRGHDALEGGTEIEAAAAVAEGGAAAVGGGLWCKMGVSSLV